MTDPLRPDRDPDPDGAGSRAAERDNGLSAPYFVPLRDIDPRLASVLLSALRDVGIAAYVVPSPGWRGAYGDVRLPERPAERLWVDGERRTGADQVVATVLHADPEHGREDVSPRPGSAAEPPTGGAATTDGTVADGSVADGTVADGTVADGTVADGTVADDVSAEPGDGSPPTADDGPGAPGDGRPPAAGTDLPRPDSPRPDSPRPDSPVPGWPDRSAASYDQEFAAIVAGFDAPVAAPSWPTTEDVEPRRTPGPGGSGIGRDPAAAPDTDASRTVRGFGRRATDVPAERVDPVERDRPVQQPGTAGTPERPPERPPATDADRETALPDYVESYLDEHFVPEPPPPLPRPQPATQLAIGAIVGGLVVLLGDPIFQLGLDPSFMLLATLAVLGGFASLVFRMRDADDHDPGDDDDGAVV